MPKRRSGTRRRSTKQRGRGIGSALRSAGAYIKRHKLLSKGLGLIPNPTAQLASRMAGMVGLGRKRRRSKRAGSRRRRVVALGTSVPMSMPAIRSMQRGRGFFGDLGGGIGSVLGGLGGGIGSAARGFFGRGRASKKVFTTF
jgi:hypothetical protein